MPAKIPTTPEQPVIGVELDFEFDKSEQLCRAIEDAYDDVHCTLDIWKKEFQQHPELSDGMYFSEFLEKREGYIMDTNEPAGQHLDMEAFFEWLDSKDNGANFTSLQQVSKTDIALASSTPNKINVFHKMPDKVDLTSSQGLLAGLHTAKAPVSLSVPSRHGTAPSRLLQRLSAANKTLAYDYDDIFEHFGDDWDHLHASTDMESHGQEVDVQELREAHYRRVQEEEKAEQEELAAANIRDISTALPEDGADDDYYSGGESNGADADTTGRETESFASSVSGQFHSSDDDSFHSSDEDTEREL